MSELNERTLNENYEKAKRKNGIINKYNCCIDANICPSCGKDLDYTVFGSDSKRLIHCSHCGFDGGWQYMEKRQ